MFMLGEEIKEYAIPNDIPYVGREAGWAQKLAETKIPGWEPLKPEGDPTKPSLYADIAAHGVREPVPISHRAEGEKYLPDAHHRVAAAADLGQYVPVRHYEGPRLGFWKGLVI